MKIKAVSRATTVHVFVKVLERVEKVEVEEEEIQNVSQFKDMIQEKLGIEMKRSNLYSGDTLILDASTAILKAVVMKSSALTPLAFTTDLYVTRSRATSKLRTYYVTFEDFRNIKISFQDNGFVVINRKVWIHFRVMYRLTHDLPLQPAGSMFMLDGDGKKQKYVGQKPVPYGCTNICYFRD